MEDSIISLRNKFLKVTPQRMAIYEYLLSTTEHPSAQTIFEHVQRQFPSISFATVYKTLNILRDAGLVLEFNVGGDCFRYDANTMAHPHFICKECEEVSDIIIPAEVISINDSILKANAGFKIDHSEMFFFGSCPCCAAKAE